MNVEISGNLKMKTENESAKAQSESFKWTDPLTLFTAALVIVGALQATFLWRGISDSKEALTITQRAFVFISLFETHVLNDTLVVMPKWENSGSTPTKTMRNYANWKVFEGEPPPTYNFPDYDVKGNELTSPGDGPEIFIGPKATLYSETLKIPIPVLEQVRSGQRRLFVWGWANYVDVFCGDHRTEFCNELVVTSLGQQGNQVSAAVSFGLYRRHNSAR